MSYVQVAVCNFYSIILSKLTSAQELPLGEDGEILVRGPQVMPDYWKAAEETAHTLHNGWLHMGDIEHVMLLLHIFPPSYPQ
ncbi:MAG: hypothetical protein NVS4B12_12800 [Ktedonobacteraceae bacterium]